MHALHRHLAREDPFTVLVPDIPAFGAPVDPALGTSLGINPAGNDLAGRSFSAVYARCEGASATQGCDIFRYDIFRGVEERVDRLSTRAHSETAPSVNLGTWAFARRGGPRPGTYAFSSSSNRLRRLTSTVALETATSATRLAFTYRSSRGYGVQVRTPSGSRLLIPAAGLQDLPRSVQVTRYRVGWLLPGAGATRVFQTRRFAGSGGPFPLEVVEAPRTLPAGVTAAAGDASFLFRRYVDAEGVKTIEPSIR